MRNTNEKLTIIGDIVLIALALYISHAVRFGLLGVFFHRYTLEAFLQRYTVVTIVLYIAVVIFSSFIMELYNYEKNVSRILLFIRVASAAIISYVILSAAFYMVPPQLRLWRGEILLSFVLIVTAQFLWHITILKFLDGSKFAKKVLIVGTGSIANTIGRLVLNTNHQHILAGYIQCSPHEVFVPEDAIVSKSSDVSNIVDQEKAQKIVVSLSERRGTLPINNILSCKLKGIEVIDAASFYEQLTGKLLIEAITPSWFIFSDGFRLTPAKILIKGLIDKAFALCASVFVLPLFPIIALLIRLDSPGPVLYRQIRVGKGDRLITIYKFRSMRQDAETESGAIWAKKGDPRVTRMGWILRKTRLDEVPQIINILKGDMSWVGPRPERPEFVEKLREIIPYYSERHAVKPGLTGWAQVKYSYGASVEDAIEKLRYDLYYIKHLSLTFDLYILLETCKVVLFGRGSR
jgi:sugar transferase (PEP-CTERM system associated)